MTRASSAPTLPVETPRVRARALAARFVLTAFSQPHATYWRWSLPCGSSRERFQPGFIARIRFFLPLFRAHIFARQILPNEISITARASFPLLLIPVYRQL
jgi:hypothetical protein